MKKKPTYIPIALLKETSHLLPGAWEKMDNAHQSNHTPGMSSWPEWCYVPFAGAISVVMDELEIKEDLPAMENPFPIINLAQIVSALSIWRKEKHVFQIEKPFLKELEQTPLGKIPSKILLQLPWQSAFIEWEEKVFNGESCGFFIHLEYDYNTHDQELRISFLMKNMQLICTAFHLDTDTIDRSIQKFYQIGLRNIEKLNNQYQAAQTMIQSQFSYHKETTVLLEKCLRIVMYLCSIKPDIEPHSEQTFIMKRDKEGIQDRYSEIQRWVVGRREAIKWEQHCNQKPRKRPYWKRVQTGPNGSSKKIKWYPPLY